MRAAGKLLGRAQRRADHARARDLRARRRRAGDALRSDPPFSAIPGGGLAPVPSRRSISATIPSRSRRRSTRQTNPSADSSTYRHPLRGNGRPTTRAARSHPAAASRVIASGTGITIAGRPTARRIASRRSRAVTGRGWPTNSDLADGGGVDRGGNRPDDVVHVHEGVGGVRAADERQEAPRGEPEQRQQRPVAWSVDHARPQDHPAQTGRLPDRLLAFQLAAP